MITVGVTKFAERQLLSDFGGTRLTPEQMDLCRRITEDLVNIGASKEGYAPFCKTVAVHASQVPGVLTPVVELTAHNEGAVKTKYQARQKGELPVLVRYLSGVQRGPSHHLNVVLYSREQLQSEDKATGQSDTPDTDWSIVAVNASPDEADSPIPPVTMMRNALGKTEGGSGFPLDHAKYLESVAYWSKYAQTE